MSKRKFKILEGDARHSKGDTELLDLLSQPQMYLDDLEHLIYICGSHTCGVTNATHVLINNIIQERHPQSYELSILDCGQDLAKEYRDNMCGALCRVRENLDIRTLQKAIVDISKDTAISASKMRIVVLHDLNKVLDSHNINMRVSITQKIINLVESGYYCIVAMNDYYDSTIAEKAKYTLTLKSTLRLSNQLIKCPKASSIKAGHFFIQIGDELLQGKLPLITNENIKENLSR